MALKLYAGPGGKIGGRGVDKFGYTQSRREMRSPLRDNLVRAVPQLARGEVREGLAAANRGGVLEGAVLDVAAGVVHRAGSIMRDLGLPVSFDSGAHYGFPDVGQGRPALRSGTPDEAL